MRISSVFRKQTGHGKDDMGSTIMSWPSVPSLMPQQAEELNALKPAEMLYGVVGRRFKIRLANRSSQQHAGELLNRRYVQRGYGEQEMDADSHRLTIAAYDNDNVIGTLSVGLDSPSGLLCDELYADETTALRNAGRKVCEFIKLAVETSSSQLHTLAALFHVAYIHAHRVRGFDDVVMEVNPRHANFYKHMLGFKVVGPTRINSRVNAEAVLMRRKFTAIQADIEKYTQPAPPPGRTIYKYFFKPKDAEGILQRLVDSAQKTNPVGEQP